MPPLSRVLVVDDNEVDRENLRRLLRGRHRIVEAATAGEGVSIAGDGDLDCVLLDYRLPDRDGTDVIAVFREHGLPVLMLTGQGNEAIAVEAMKRGAHDYLSKGRLDADGLERAIEGAIERHRLQRALTAQREELERAVIELESKKSELEASNRALAVSESRLRVILEQLPAVAWTTGKDLGLRAMSGAALKAMGVESPPPVGTPILAESALVGASVEAVDAHRHALSGERARYRATVRDRVFECSVEPLRDERALTIGVIGIALDITEMTRLEQRLSHAAKMEAVGMLAGGVAHDFNNLLTAIVGFVDFAREGLPADSAARADLGEAIAASERAVDLVRQLLAFSRRDHASPPTDIEVHEVVARVLPMLRRLLKEDVQVDFVVGERMWTRMDRRALEQILVNLAVNARDAMPRGGRLVIRVTPRVLDGYDSPVAAAGLTGSFVELSVADGGGGIPPEVLERIFEPFFTTKAPGRGTGLGLSTCYGLAQRAGGTIEVESRPGLTVFRVILPRVDEPEAPTATHVRVPPHGAETILLLEDDPQVRAVVSRMLRHVGYAVLVAANGQKAVDIARLHPGPIHLMLSDMVMPEMDGPTAVERVRAVRPGLRALFMSGYVESASGPPSLPPGSRIIEKPVMLDDLAVYLREVLDALPEPGQ